MTPAEAKKLKPEGGRHMTRPSIIYVSGPISTGGNVPVNVRRGIEAAVIIMDRGYVVICPHEKAFGMEMLSPRGYEDWMAYDYRCIEASDAVYRMPEPSVGGDREVEYALRIGRPVYHSLDTLFAGVPSMGPIRPAGRSAMARCTEVRCHLGGWHAGRCMT